MFIRDDLNTTLADLAQAISEREDNSEDLRVEGRAVAFHLSDTATPHISLGDTAVPATDTALKTFGDMLQIPASFMKRAQEKASPAVLDALLNDLARASITKDLRATLVGNHLHEVNPWAKAKPVTPGQIVQVAANAIDPLAPVSRLIDEPGFFGFDVYAPEGFAHGYGSNGVTAYADGNEEDDITAGGLRFGIDRKHNLAPYVEEYMYRLACTNGMQVRNAGLKVDARGQTVEEVLLELESMAKVAFDKVESDIAHFYDLKTQQVDNVERALRQIAREQKIPNRSTMALMDLAASSDMPDNPTMFDVVNLVTNYANSPAMAGRDGGRLILEGAGGSVISEHAVRCGHCQQKVG